DWPALVAQALAALARPGRNEVATTLLQEASKQCPEVLHPHLDALFGVPYLPGCRAWPWHGSGARHVESLRKQMAQGSGETPRRAWECLLATQDDQVVRLALREAPGIYRRWARPGYVAYDRWLAASLAE